MSCLCNRRWCFTFGFMLALVSGILLGGYTLTVRAEQRDFRHREFIDSQYGHNRSYPSRGQFMQMLPSGHRVAFYGKARYYFHGGVWYRPQGRGYVIAMPPFGMIVPFLPPYYATIWVGGLPYYYANEIYYTQGAGGYVVVEPPKGEVGQAPLSAGQVSSDQLFIYPRQGQREQKQATDRYECHLWAVSQTGYDPTTQPPAGLPVDQMIQKRKNYQRAMSACLDGRGYTVK